MSSKASRFAPSFAFPNSTTPKFSKSTFNIMNNTMPSGLNSNVHKQSLCLAGSNYCSYERHGPSFFTRILKQSHLDCVHYGAVISNPSLCRPRNLSRTGDQYKGSHFYYGPENKAKNQNFVNDSVFFASRVNQNEKKYSESAISSCSTLFINMYIKTHSSVKASRVDGPCDKNDATIKRLLWLLVNPY